VHRVVAPLLEEVLRQTCEAGSGGEVGVDFFGGEVEECVGGCDDDGDVV